MMQSKPNISTLLRLTCLLLLIAVKGIAQQSDTFPSIDAKDFPEASFNKPKIYTGASLFGYMNGGAELYREYGCSGAWICELEFMGGKYKIEVFKMNDTEEAFGIFSVSRFNCNSAPPLSPFTCQTPYQLQICSGTYYVNIINTTGNANDSVAALRIGTVIARKIKEKPADISTYLPGIPLEVVNNKAVLVKGELGILNSVPDLVDYFGDDKGYRAVILQTEAETLLSVKFADESQVNDFVKRLKSENDEKLAEEKISAIAPMHLLIKFGR